VGGKAVRVKRITKGTSGKVQRHALERAQISDDFNTELKELDTLIAANVGSERILNPHSKPFAIPLRVDAGAKTHRCSRQPVETTIET
jgi:hypothetical protein